MIEVAEHKASIFQGVRSWLIVAKWRAIKMWKNALDRMRWLGHKPCALELHAERELRLAGWLDNDGIYGDMLGRSVLRMIREFSDEGHSGMSAPAAIGLFERAAAFLPLTPLTGEDDEWVKLDYGDDVLWQNNRCGRVFKDAKGQAYDIEGRVFREPSWSCYTSRESRVYVTFPYQPSTEYVDVPNQETDHV